MAAPGASQNRAQAERQDHWEGVYRVKRADQVSWYRPHLETSLQLIRQVLPDLEGRIIDVGAGESTLVDDLLALGYRHIDLLDISATALEVARRRVGPPAARVRWLVGDVTTYPIESSSHDLWHDRAVFHFMTRPEDRAAYVRQLMRAVKPGGHAIIATFGPEGPTRCSGLDVVRYGADAMRAELGARLRLVTQLLESHRTPAGAEQQFLYCVFTVQPDRAPG